MQPISIERNHAGGNIHVVSIDGNRVKVEQELRDTTIWWWYWNFAAAGTEAGQEVIFEFVNGEVIGPWGPAVSSDGVDWTWLGSDSLIDRRTFRFRFEEADRKVYFAFSLPYQVQHFERLAMEYQKHPRVERRILTVSEQGRAVPLWLVGNPAAGRHMMLTARHHACESTASHMTEGLLRELLDRDSELLEQFLIHYVPFVDIDGVENGDQGKGRDPHDHNRDYIAEPMYRSTSAIMEYVRKLPLEIALDCHCPVRWGDPEWGLRDDYPFIVKAESPMKERMEEFGAILNRITLDNPSPGKLVYDAVHDIEVGDSWNQGVTTMSASCGNFMRQQCARLALSFEFPYFGIGEHIVTAASCRQFGADMARALEAYALRNRG